MFFVHVGSIALILVVNSYSKTAGEVLAYLYASFLVVRSAQKTIADYSETTEEYESKGNILGVVIFVLCILVLIVAA